MRCRSSGREREPLPELSVTMTTGCMTQLAVCAMQLDDRVTQTAVSITTTPDCMTQLPVIVAQTGVRMRQTEIPAGPNAVPMT